LPCVAATLAAVLLLSPSVMAAPLAPRLAVFELELRNVRLKASMARILRDYLSDAIAATGAYRVVPGDKLRSALRREQLKSRMDCFKKSCQRRIGEALSADYSLSTRVMRIGKTCTVTSIPWNLDTQVADKGAKAEGGCGEEHIKHALDAVVRKLAGAARAGGGTRESAPPPIPGTGKVPDPEELPAVAPELGILRVEGTPRGARVDVKGPRGFQGPKAAALPRTWPGVPAGKYRIKVRAQDHDPHEAEVQVLPDRTRVVAVELRKSYGRLTIGGQPRGARVELSCAGGYGKVFGLPRSLTLKRVPRGTCGVKVSRMGYTSYAREVEVLGGKETRLVVKLEQVELPKEGETRSVKGKSDLQWVLIPGGTYRMGSTDGAKDERPAHRVRVNSFYLGQTEVTTAQYLRCVGERECRSPEWKESGNKYNLVTGTDKHYRGFTGARQPVVGVSWKDARKYCVWAGGRLPSEAEWEYAARSRGRAQKYPWGNEEATCGRAVMGHPRACTTKDPCGCGQNRTWPVCKKTSGNTAQGLCDMAGNVWEWVEDCWHKDYSGAPSDGSAWTAGCSGRRRVLRGGSWYHNASYLRAAFRNLGAPAYRGSRFGFRCARTKN